MHANTSPLPSPKDQHCPLHLRKLRFVVREPALGAENLGVVSEDALVILDHSGVDADFGTFGEKDAGHLGAAGRDVARHAGAERRVQTRAFFDAGVEVGKLDRLAVFDIRRGEFAGLRSGVDFGLQLAERGRVLH